MNVRRFVFVTMLSFATSGAAWSQTETTTRVDVKTVTGEVIRLEPGKTIVVRSGGEEVSYVLAPGVTLPSEVQVGRSVSLQIEPGPAGGSIVKRVKTTSVTPEGQVKEKTETTRTDALGQTTHTTTTISGKVEAYMPGKSVTVIDSKGARVTYVLSAESQMPTEVVMGKEVTVLAAPTQEPGVTYEIEKDGNTIKIKAKSKPQD